MSDQLPTPATQAIDNVSPAVTRSLPRRGRGRNLLWQVQQALAVALLAVGCYFLISHFLLQSVTVVGSSMIPTLANSDRYLLNRWIFHVRQPQRNEVVVIRDPADNGYSVKRIIGTGGDTISLRQGEVYLNGRKLIEPYLPQGTPTFGDSYKEEVYHLDAGYYFLLGDNRRNSVDSRSYGPVARKNILGLVVR